jgi:hypothetical protein
MPSWSTATICSSRAIRANVPALRKVRWNYRNNYRGGAIDARVEDFQALFTAHAPNLVELDLGRTSFETPTLFANASFINLLPRLEVLRLPYTALGCDGAELLATVRENARRLAHLRELEVTHLAGVDVQRLQKLVPSFAWVDTSW